MPEQTFYSDPLDYDFDTSSSDSNKSTPPPSPVIPIPTPSSSSQSTSLPILNEDIEMVWSIPHLREYILSGHGDIYRKTPYRLYSNLKENCPKQRAMIYFDTIGEIDFTGIGRPPHPAKWAEILDDCPNLPRVSRGNKILFRQDLNGKNIFTFQWQYCDTLILGEPHSRLKYPFGTPNEWVLRPILHITISKITNISDMVDRSRLFQDSLLTKVKALEGKLESLEIELPLPSEGLSTALQNLKKYEYLALKTFSLVQYDDGIIDVINLALPTLKSLTISSNSDNTTSILLPGFLEQFNWTHTSNLEELTIHCRLPDFKDISTIRLKTPIIPQNMLPLSVLRKTEFRVIYDETNHPLKLPNQSPTYLNFI